MVNKPYFFKKFKVIIRILIINKVFNLDFIE